MVIIGSTMTMTGRTHEMKNALRLLLQSSMTISLIVVCCVFLWSSLGLSRVSAWVPRLILSTTLILLLLQLVREFRESGHPEEDGGAHGFAAVGPVLLWIVTMLLFVWLAGVSIGAALFCLAYMRIYAREHWLVAAGFAICLGLVVHLFFGTLMQVSLYQGVILPFLMY